MGTALIMIRRSMYWAALLLVLYVSTAQAQYDDFRCVCVCPDPLIINGTQSNRTLYIDNVLPDMCNCDTVILPRVPDNIKGRPREFCPRCDCKYESRNTTIIKVVIIIVIWMVSLLVIYMVFLMCLDPLLNKRSSQNYQEHTDEDESIEAPGPSSHPMVTSSGVLNRVGHQQDKWKKQVQEQRRNIYDRHTMLN